MKYLKIVASAILSLALVACGGGGGSGGTPAGGTGGGTTTSAAVASFTVALSQPGLNDSGTDSVTATVQAVDANHNPVAGAKVTGAVDSGVFVPTGTVTDAKGNFVGTVTIGTDKSQRTINLTITVNSLSQQISIPVTGPVITMTPVPFTPAPGQPVALNLQVLDSAGKGISGVVVTLGGTAGFSGTVTTAGAQGTVTATAVAPATAGSYTVTASGAGVTATPATIQVVAAGGSTLPAAGSLGTSQSLTANPTSIATNLSGSTANQAQLSAKFLAAGNAGIQYMRVRFDIVAPALGAGEYISTGTATVYSDVNGLATANYVSGTRSSPTNGVLLRACYATTDAGLAADPITGVLPCPNSVSATLTVAGQPMSIAIVNQNTMTKDSTGLFYQEQFGIQVADSSGIAVKGAVVSVSVDITHYGKGLLWNNHFPVPKPDINFVYPWQLPVQLPASFPNQGTSSYSWQICSTTDSNGNILASCFASQAPSRIPYVSNSTYTDDIFPDSLNSVWCMNEDLNRNGSLDLGEDLNKDGVLEPRSSEVVLSYVNGNATDANGRVFIQASYGQNMGGWLAYTIKATTNVVGSEGTNSQSFVTSVLKADVPNGSFLSPPYGSGRCIDPN